MDVIEALKSRVSIRAFTPQPVSKETVLKIMEAATRAPSWSNTQPWEIYVAGGESLERIRRGSIAGFENRAPRAPDLALPQQWPEALRQRSEEVGTLRFQAMGIAREDKAARHALSALNYALFHAPAVVFLCMDRTLTPWSILDIGMLAQSIMLAAREYDVDTMPAVNLVMYPSLIRAELGIPVDQMVLFGIALGYRDPQQPVNHFRSPRRPVQEVVRFKGF